MNPLCWYLLKVFSLIATINFLHFNSLKCGVTWFLGVSYFIRIPLYTMQKWHPPKITQCWRSACGKPVMDGKFEHHMHWHQFKHCQKRGMHAGNRIWYIYLCYHIHLARLLQWAKKMSASISSFATINSSTIAITGDIMYKWCNLGSDVYKYGVIQEMVTWRPTHFG